MMSCMMFRSLMTTTCCYVSVKCARHNVSAKYPHCRVSSPGNKSSQSTSHDPAESPAGVFVTGGVSDLECFGKHSQSSGKKTCTWRRGASSSNFTLVIKQRSSSRSYCWVYPDISDTSVEVKVYQSYQMTAQVLELVGSNCSQDVFRAHPSGLLRCGPPPDVTFRRHLGSVHVHVEWSQEDVEVVRSLCVRHKAAGGGQWKEACCGSASECQVSNVNTSEVYQVQVRCETSDKCSQCPWGEVFPLAPGPLPPPPSLAYVAYTSLNVLWPSELTALPVLVHVDEQQMATMTGQRTLSLTWMLPGAVLPEGYRVCVAKVSGESENHVTSVRPHVTLVLSSSSFHVDVSAVNNASESPAVRITVPPRAAGHGMLNVSVHSNASFTISWEDDLVSWSVCFCMEWSSEGRPVAYKSFYEDTNNFWTVSDITERLEAYRRYHVWLHVRPQRPPCNLKSVNNSEVTYASAPFYFLEGSPLSAPANVSVVNVTLSSVALCWSSIPQEELRGFLLGYVIHYAENQQQETNISVPAHVHSYTLEGLQRGTVYKIQVSGVTRAGAGVRSAARVIRTHERGSLSLTVVFIVSGLTVVVLTVAFFLMKSKAKVAFWPNIPTPEKSIVLQKLNVPSEMLFDKTMDALKVEEFETSSLLIVEVGAADPVDTPAALLPADQQRADVQRLPAAASGAYTSMAAVQQLMVLTQRTAAKSSDDGRVTGGKPGMDYVTQFLWSLTAAHERKPTCSDRV
uniref:interleukin-6 receptor subunit beta isoform X2 n=1 Tax=Doryrhamphus excisus TaxID=161450 RepID=UPI0025AE2F3D|nr:interleukin-6 receptor subunit beta isoform X2 [Doryrhamphus excisus]